MRERLLILQLLLTIVGAQKSLEFLDLLPEDPKLYDKMRPPKKDGQPTIVYFHVTVMGLDSIDEGSMTYAADIFFAQTWKDNRLRLPENMTSEYRLLEVDWLKNMWRPDSFFKNAKSVTFQTMTIPNHYLWLYKDKTILYMVKLTLKLSCAMNFLIYPHDTQECKLQMESLSHTTEEMIFQWDPDVPLVVDENIELPQLQLIKNYTADCTQVYSTGNFTCLEVIFVLKRRLGYYLFHTYVPTCLIVIMSWVSFWIKPEAAPARVTLGVTSLLTLSTQHAKSQAALPPVSYLKAVDAFMSVCTIFVFMALMEYCLVNIVLVLGESPEKSPKPPPPPPASGPTTAAAGPDAKLDKIFDIARTLSIHSLVSAKVNAPRANSSLKARVSDEPFIGMDPTKINNNSKSSWTRRIAIGVCLLLALLLVLIENTCLFGRLSRRVLVPRRFEVKVEEIPLDDVESMERRAIARVQLVPLWTDNDTIKDTIEKYKILHDRELVATRHLPSALIIGVKKGGTRALLEFLRVHPDVRAAGSEVHFFDHHYSKGFHWYRRKMPTTLEGQVTMEKTPSYFVTAEAPRRVQLMDPGAKLIVVVRDPVTRAISDYTQVRSKRKDMPRFEDLAFVNGSQVVDTTWAPLRIGVYATHLERWLNYFPLSQLLFVSGERLISDPALEITRVQDFLGIKRLISEKHFYFNATKGFPCLLKSEQHGTPHCLGKNKGRSHPYIEPTAIERLRDFYRPFNRRFYQLTGIDFGWP